VNTHAWQGKERCTIHHHGHDSGPGTKAHSQLGVLVCDEHANEPEDFVYASDSYRLNCQWCDGQRDPGDRDPDRTRFFLCVSCGGVGCENCLIYNFGEDEAERITGLDDWECYLCNPTPQLLALQQLCTKHFNCDLAERAGSQPPLFASSMMNEGIDLLQIVLTEATAAADVGLSIEGITPFEVSRSHSRRRCSLPPHGV